VGAVAYLNSRPLTEGMAAVLEEQGLGRLLLAPPAQLSDDLAVGKLDVALVSTAEFLRGDYTLLRPGCIASVGEVLSVRLFSRVPLAEIRGAALDPESRTSNLLVQVLARHLWSITPRWMAPGERLTANTPAELPPGCDAFLAIGDRALALHGTWPVEVDLGEAWYELTGLPFVFGVWAVRRGVHLGAFPQLLKASLQRGLAARGALAAEAAKRLGLDAAFLQQYLTQHVRFELGNGELAGIEMFYRLLLDDGLVEPFGGIEFYSEPKPVASGTGGA